MTKLKVQVQPYNSITIKGYMKFDSPKDFAESILASIARTPKDLPEGTIIGRLFWSNGVVFRHYPFAQTEAVTKVLLEGKIYYDHVEFAEMPQYQKEISVGDGLKVEVSDFSGHSVFDKLTEYISKKLLSKTTNEGVAPS